MAGITNNVPDGAVMLGVPATPERDQKLQLAAMSKLPEMRREFKSLRRTVSDLQKAVGIDDPAENPASNSSEQAA